jgi:glutamine amidotransferase
MNRVAIVDYGMSNLDSIRRAIEEVGGSPYVVASPDVLGHPDRIVLPGVGAFSLAMANLRANGLDRALADEVLGDGVPFLGVCLGMQLLGSDGDEGGPTSGFGWIPGRISRLAPTRIDRRVPHVGWNEVVPADASTLFEGIERGTDFYFVHSYHLCPADDQDVAATTPYCGGFTSAIARGAVFGVQFHPEKSQRAGFTILRNFLAV